MGEVVHVKGQGGIWEISIYFSVNQKTALKKNTVYYLKTEQNQAAAGFELLSIICQFLLNHIHPTIENCIFAFKLYLALWVATIHPTQMANNIGQP